MSVHVTLQCPLYLLSKWSGDQWAICLRLLNISKGVVLMTLLLIFKTDMLMQKYFVSDFPFDSHPREMKTGAGCSKLITSLLN